MELQDFTAYKKRSNHSFKTHNFQNGDFNRYKSYHPREGNFNLPNLINGIKNNKKIKTFAIIAVVIILSILIALVAVLLPLIIKIFNYLTSVGFPAIIDTVSKFINDLLSNVK